MTDLLAVTLGNTSVAIAVADAEGVLHDVRREPLAHLETLLAERLASAGDAAGPAIVGSVNPPALARLRKALQTAEHGPPRVAGRDFPIPIATAVDEPARVGTDRLLAALAAYRRARGPCIVVDVGTAVTVNAVDGAGTFLGGAIFPGPDLMARALAEGTAQLPNVDMHAGPVPESVVGKNTRDAIRTGVHHGWRGGITMMLAAALSEVGEHATVFLTGGYLALLKSEANDFLGGYDEDGGESDRRPRVVPDLVLEGLVLAWREHANR
ncbi:MAG: type III pantothenate kinase [Planctomycetes bacterium]|nr:type III pantothenate kinase [Planctomycetota bacterium]